MQLLPSWSQIQTSIRVLKFGIFKSLVYRCIAPYRLLFILSTFSSFVQATIITMHWTNLNMQFENIGSLALLYIYSETIIGSIYNTWSSIMRIKHIR